MDPLKNVARLRDLLAEALPGYSIDAEMTGGDGHALLAISHLGRLVLGTDALVPARHLGEAPEVQRFVTRIVDWVRHVEDETRRTAGSSSPTGE